MHRRFPVIAISILVGCVSLVPAGPATATTFHPAAVPAPGLFYGSAGYEVVDAVSGQVLAANNEHTLLEPASMMKMMTAVLAVEHLPLTQLVTISPAAAARDIGDLQLYAGETFTVEQLLEAALVPSDNNAAYALGEATGGGDINAWKQMAAAKGAQLGFVDAGVVYDPTGWAQFADPANSAKITADDLIKVANVAFHNPIIQRIIAMKSIRIVDTNGRATSAISTDLLLGMYPGIVGGKTGTTNSAGECFSGFVKRGNSEVITIVFHSPDRFGQTAQAVNWVFGTSGTVTVTGGTALGAGYVSLTSDGVVTPHGAAPTFGNATPTGPGDTAVAIAATPSGKGYWIALASGGVQTFGDAPPLGDMSGTALNAPIINMSPTPSGKGYWLVAGDGGIFTFGDASFLGSMGNVVLNKPVVGMTSTPSGHGYWLVAADGGIFTFGDAPFLGSMGNVVLNKPVVGMTSTPSGHGYQMVATDGGIFTFGDAPFLGSLGSSTIDSQITAAIPNSTNTGYWLMSVAGGNYNFGAAAAV